MSNIQLSALRGGPGAAYFLEFARQSGLNDRLNSLVKYTVLVPTDNAFREWFPVDWGFNPFHVAQFVDEVMANHILEGRISIQKLRGTDNKEGLKH